MSGVDRLPGHRVDCAEAIRSLGRYSAIIDVRSESEFDDDHLPGAINCPVLDDAERARVGTIYCQESPFAARRIGAVLVARHIAAHIEARFASMPADWRPLVYCWRGGERSGAMAHVLGRIGWRAQQLAGGYKAYRRLIVEDLESLPGRYALRVVIGPTGSGKTRLLGSLARAGAQVLDLEALARHRGSVLGCVPSQAQPSQRSFESAIWWALSACDPRRPVFVEAESRRIGVLQVPNALLERIRASECLRIQMPLAQRVRLLRDEYGHLEQDPGLLAAQLGRLVDVHGRERIAQWNAQARSGAWEALVGELLRIHYDPMYERSIRRHFGLSATAREVVIGTADAPQFDRTAFELTALESVADPGSASPPGLLAGFAARGA
ncbi:MAG TPA: tRNA 2-selenouridine(34) synthase MnmH [Burkholderiaceae bacterium]|nr:tRNA 2-selenouridine(34) synthase MnmH [Burkholderiaceae bacterium]